jgi:hypothetical protein
VSEDLRRDYTRQETLALIDKIENPQLRDRLRSITAMRTLGLAPQPKDAADRIFSGPTEEPPEIEPGDNKP